MERQEYHYGSGPEKLTIQGDEDLLSQVWINLLHNAVKFTPEDGVIRIILKADNNEVYCQIVDTGIGIGWEDWCYLRAVL